MKLKARFALAHEVAHVLQRHETKELQGMIVDSFTAKDEMQKAILNAKKDPDGLLRNVKVGKDIYVTAPDRSGAAGGLVLRPAAERRVSGAA